MICYHCEKIGNCPIFNTLESMSKDFCINDCQEYNEVSKYKYKRIAEHENLMHLIYDYFTGQVDGDYSDDEIKKVITSALRNL